MFNRLYDLHMAKMVSFSCIGDKSTTVISQILGVIHKKNVLLNAPMHTLWENNNSFAINQ